VLELLAFAAIAIVLVFWAMRKDDRRNSASRAAAPPPDARPRAGRSSGSPSAFAGAPTKFAARWLIKYVDACDVSTKRIVRVQRVHPELQQLDCWCELRNAGRTFAFGGLRQIVDVETGEIVDLPEWLAAYAASRRQRKKRSAPVEGHSPKR
jgi:hypothetical protein